MKKKIAVVVGLLLLAAGVFAQTNSESAQPTLEEILELEKKSDELFHAKKYFEAASILEKSLSVVFKFTDVDNQTKTKVVSRFLRKLRDIYTVAGLTNLSDINAGRLGHEHLKAAIKILQDGLYYANFFADGNNSMAVDNHKFLGSAYSAVPDYNKALESYKTALEINQKINGAEDESNVDIIVSIGEVLNDQTEYDLALEIYCEALELQKKYSTEDDEKLAEIYEHIANVYEKKFDYEKEEGEFNKAALIYKNKNMVEELAYVYMKLSYVCSVQTKYKDALGYCEEVLKLDESAYDSATVYEQSAGICLTYGDYSKAREYIDKAVAIFFSKGVEEETHRILFDYYFRINDMKNALVYCKKYIEVSEIRFGKKHYFVASLYDILGGIYEQLFEYNKALESYDKALSIYLEIYGGKKNGAVAQSYSGKGSAYYFKGDLSNALVYYNYALDYIDEKNYSLLSSIYSMLGNIYMLQGKMDEVDKCFSECEKNDVYFYGEDNPNLIDQYLHLATSYLTTPDFDKAAKYIKKAEKLLRSQDDIHVCEYYSTLGAYYLLKEEDMKALENLQKAAEGYEKIYGSNHPETALSYYGIALVYDAMDQEQTALEYFSRYEECTEMGFTNYLTNSFDLGNMKSMKLAQKIVERSIVSFENARDDMVSLKTDISAKAMASYYYGIQIETQLGNYEKAFEYSESFRSRGFLDQIGTEAALRFDGVTENDRLKIRELQTKIIADRKTVEAQNGKSKSQQDTELKLKASEDLALAEQQLSDLDAALSKKVPKYAQLRNPKPATAKEAQKWCGKKRAVLEYVLWDQSLADPKKKAPDINSYCIVITEKGVNIVPLDTEGFDYEDDIAALVNHVSNGLKPEKDKNIKPGGNIERRQIELYEFLIAPVEEYINGAEELVIVPDGALFKLPFDLLKKNSSSEMLGDKYAVTLSPSVSVSIIADAVKNKSGKTLAIGAAWYDKTLSEKEHARVFSDEKFAKEYIAKAAYPNDLPGSSKEIDRLKRTAFKSKSFDVVVQQDATEKKIKDLSSSKRLSEYTTVLFSGHGEFDKSGKSGILFSETSGLFEVEEAEKDDAIDGRLTVGEVALLNLNAEMFMLSACQTGLGEVENGDGFTGLARAFMVAGCKNVGASLWKVDDEATAEFMARIFDKVQNKKVPYAQAYKETKAEFRKMEKWSAPYYWAAFVLWE